MPFAVYLHPETCETSKPVDQIEFIGHSLPHFRRIRHGLAHALSEYPALSLRQAAYSDYLRVHTPAYLEKLKRMAADEALEDPPKLSIECAGYQYCLPGYLYGLGGMMEAVDRMRDDAIDRAYCFSLGGHHTYADRGHGYCLLNPQAAATRYAQERGFERVLIVDWDLHHGDGTQAIFAYDPSVYCISIHSGADLYMATMKVLREGTTTRGIEVGHCNIPLLSEAYGDDFQEKTSLPGTFYRAAESLPAFEAALESLPWQPDLIMTFSGYDSHRDDCGAGVTNWVDTDYETLTRLVLGVAQASRSPVLSVHGGGYTVDVAIAAARRHVDVLAEGE